MQDQEKNDTFHSMREQRSKENAIREKFDREISNYKEKLAIMERENETLRSQLKYGQFASNNKEDNMELEYKIESLTNENKRILKENSDLAEEAKEYKLKVFDLKDEKEDLLVQLDDNKEKYKEKNESFRKILTKKDDEVTNLKQQNLDLIQKVEEYKHENFQTTQNTEWYEKDKNLLKDKVSELKSDLGEKDYEIKELNLEIRTLKKRIKSFENNKLVDEKSNYNRKSEREIEYEVTEQRNKLLEEKLEEMEKEFYSLQKELLDKKDNLYSN